MLNSSRRLWLELRFEVCGLMHLRRGGGYASLPTTSTWVQDSGIKASTWILNLHIKASAWTSNLRIKVCNLNSDYMRITSTWVLSILEYHLAPRLAAACFVDYHPHFGTASYIVNSWTFESWAFGSYCLISWSLSSWAYGVELMRLWVHELSFCFLLSVWCTEELALQTYQGPRRRTRVPGTFSEWNERTESKTKLNIGEGSPNIYYIL